MKNLFCICIAMWACSPAFAQIKVGEQPTIQNKSVSLDLQGNNNLQGIWLPRVTDTSVNGIRALNPPSGLMIFHPPSGKVLMRVQNSWLPLTYNGIELIRSGTAQVNGPIVNFTTSNLAGNANNFNIAVDSISKSITFNLPDATPTVRGAVTTTAQTFGGAKTFANGITVNNGSILNNGTIANGGLNVTNATGATSNLTLGINSNTVPGPTAEKYLSVNANGNVTLNAVNVITNNTTRIKTYILQLDDVPHNLNNNTSKRFTFTIPGGNLSTTSTVYLSPTTALNIGSSVDWVRVMNPTTIELSMSTKANGQVFTNGNNGWFNVTVIEF